MERVGVRSFDEAVIAKLLAVVLLLAGIVFWNLLYGANTIEMVVESRFPYQLLAIFALAVTVVACLAQCVLLMAGAVSRTAETRKVLIAVSGIVGLISSLFLMAVRFYGVTMLWVFILVSDIGLVVMAVGYSRNVRDHAATAKKCVLIPCVISLLLAVAEGWRLPDLLLPVMGLTALWGTAIFQIIGSVSSVAQGNVASGAVARNDVEAFRMIKELKGLLDEGALTQDEFDSRKRILLGLKEATNCDANAATLSDSVSNSLLGQ